MRYFILIFFLIIMQYSFPIYAHDAVFMLPSLVRVEIVEKPFDISLFSVSGCDTVSSGCLISGRIPFGVEATLPKTYVKTIVISYKDKKYILNSSDMYNAWGDRDLKMKGVRYFGGKCFDTINCQFRGVFSDASGSYAVEWKIINGVSIRTVLSNSSDVVKLFLKNIDPPEYY